MAAGLGTRMKSGTPKVLHRLCGRPMLAYVLDAWAEAVTELGEGTDEDPGDAPPPVIVYSPPTAAVTAAFDGLADFALQDEPRGTGDAVRAALDAVPGVDEIVVLSGDVPLVTGPDLAAVLEARREDDAAIALASVLPPTRPASAASCAASSGPSNASSRRRTRPTTSWRATRSMPGCTRSTLRGSAAGSPRSAPPRRRASCT